MNSILQFYVSSLFLHSCLLHTLIDMIIFHILRILLYDWSKVNHVMKDISPIIDGRSKKFVTQCNALSLKIEELSTQGNALSLKIIQKRTKTGVIKRALPMSAIKTNTCAHRTLKGLG